MKERNMSVQLVALSLLGVNNVFSEEEMVWVERYSLGDVALPSLTNEYSEDFQEKWHEFLPLKSTQVYELTVTMEVC